MAVELKWKREVTKETKEMRHGQLASKIRFYFIKKPFFLNHTPPSVIRFSVLAVSYEFLKCFIAVFVFTYRALMNSSNNFFAPSQTPQNHAPLCCLCVRRHVCIFENVFPGGGGGYIIC